MEGFRKASHIYSLWLYSVYLHINYLANKRGTIKHSGIALCVHVKVDKVKTLMPQAALEQAGENMMQR